jgi:hypothetical protein
MFETSHRAVKLGALIATSVVVLGGAAAAAGALPSPIQGAAHDALSAAGISVPSGDNGAPAPSDDVAVSSTDDTTTTTGDTTTTTTSTEPKDPTTADSTSTDPKGPDPNGPAKYGLCNAYAAGHGSTNGNKTNSTAFQALTDAASSAGQTVTEFCTDATPGGQTGTADTITTTTTTGTNPTAPTAHPGATRNHGAGPHGNPHKP